MQVMVEVTDEIRREAEKRGQPIERIRALRSAAPIPPLPKR